eukprot:1160389-Pelagomonas_calceolata.AAC.11
MSWRVWHSMSWRVWHSICRVTERCLEALHECMHGRVGTGAALQISLEEGSLDSLLSLGHGTATHTMCEPMIGSCCRFRHFLRQLGFMVLMRRALAAWPGAGYMT